jgi:hypothetical protein
MSFENTEKCPDGFRCGRCVAADKVNAENAGERELYSARQEMLAQQIAAKRAYEAKATAREAARIDTAVRVGELYVRGLGVYDGPNGVSGTNQLMGLDATLPRRRTFTREEVLTVLRTRRAMMDMSAKTDAARYNELGDLLQIFERME